jgi:hypothetical protein
VKPDSRSRLYRLSLPDLALIVALLALPGFFVFSLVRPRTEKTVVSVYHAGELIGNFPIERDTVVDLPDAGVRIEFKAGRVRVVESDCPNQVCVRTGGVSRPGRSIICVPNKVLVELRGSKSEYDSESY